MADGPTIQLSSNRAFGEGINLDDIFKPLQMQKINNKLPVILMGYYNVICIMVLKSLLKNVL